MSDKIKTGDLVAYCTKDSFGYEYIVARVRKIDKGQAHLRILPDLVALLIPLSSLTKIKTVWADTHKIVEEKANAEV